MASGGRTPIGGRHATTLEGERHSNPIPRALGAVDHGDGLRASTVLGNRRRPTAYQTAIGPAQARAGKSASPCHYDQRRQGPEDRGAGVNRHRSRLGPLQAPPVTTVEGDATQDTVCLSCSYASGRQVSYGEQCRQERHAIISRDRWRELNADYRAPLGAGRYGVVEGSSSGGYEYRGRQRR